MIRVEGLCFRYRGGAREALHDLSLEIEPGEFVVVTGPSGCGKSTLALAIGGYLYHQFDGETRGTVTVAGMDARACPVADIAEVVGLVQQNPETQFCTLTVRDEVAFGLENRCLPRHEISERIGWALRIVGADHLAERHLATLSGGEKQKVAIAAMMAARPQVLIFDEPTSNLDPSATAEVFGVIEDIRAHVGITVIVIEHKIDYLRRFGPRRIQMEDGCVKTEEPGEASSMRQEAGRVNEPHRSPSARQRALVRVEGVYAGYDGYEVLRGLSTEIRAGEFVSVMGDNGSGKTTFLYCLLGLQRPSRGRIDVMGRDTRTTPVSELARQAGLVFQNPDHQLFADTVWEEATLAARNFGLLDDKTHMRVAELLIRCGLGDRLDDHPYRLSYGQKRRLNLVSVLAYEPPLILLDEPLIGQDPDNVAFLLGLLCEHVDRGGAVVMVNHAPQITRRYASRVLFFEQCQPVLDAPTALAFSQLRALGKVAYVA